ncbi:cytochrome c oxidase subunit 3 family protein [Thiohalomonas denitrificans]|uniref:Nitric oxide reductase NorE protein n=1 Tax=Thiohalomonas denitrificans TaxID=415747 RepID=A0A1G5Q9W8_9GAMM|nr:cytochrome c oxidase subunit 3 family protein [Thiohalomonas denitrificans]SCZ58171.1 nitric oxide reductase NorE protein [Thiohalomonas denitrificans]
MTTAVATERRLPGDLAIWFFIFAELLVFGVLFLSYAFTRNGDVALFNASQLTLDRVGGMFNTLALITSSYFVVRAVVAIRADRQEACSRWLIAAMGMGGLFLAIKTAEFAGKFAAGVGLSTNTFYMFYLMMTFFHYMHVILGMVILGYILLKTRNGGYFASEHTGIESGASYWHMVDLVWIVLFPLVYVIR